MQALEEFCRECNEKGWLIPSSELKVGKIIGRGASGITYVGTHKGKKVAIKAYSAEIIKQDAKSVMNEMELMSKLSHPNIIHFCGLCLNTDLVAPSLVTDFAENGELGDALYERKLFRKGGNAMRYHVAIGLAKGLQYLHGNNVVHRDIKPANVLLSDDFSPMLTDFGFSRFIENSGNMTGETGSYRYMAPEITQHQKYDGKADTYSYAILINEMFCEERPFDKLLPIHAAVGVVKKGLRPSQKKIKSEALKMLIQQCWEQAAVKRPEWNYIISELEKCAKEEDAQPKGEGFLIKLLNTIS